MKIVLVVVYYLSGCDMVGGFLTCIDRKLTPEINYKNYHQNSWQKSEVSYNFFQIFETTIFWINYFQYSKILQEKNKDVGWRVDVTCKWFNL